MIISERNIALANELVQLVQEHTETVSDGEGVAISMLWLFFTQHAHFEGLDVMELARHQFEDFLLNGHACLAIKPPASATH